MATIPKWLVVSKGGLATVVVTPQTVAANGGTTDGTAITVTAKLSSLGKQMSPTKKNIKAITSARDHSVVVSDSISMKLSVLYVDNGTNPEPLETALLSNDVFKISYTVGQHTSGRKAVTLYASRGTYDMAADDEGEIIGTLNFDSVDAGSDTYAEAIT